MKIINKYILDELKGPIILAVFVFTFIFLLDIVVTMMEHIIVKGISVFDVLRLLSFYIPPILTQTIPIGMFLGIMICFTKFSRNSESVAMVSTGMSIRDILKPILAIAIGASIFIIFLQESIIPRSFIKLKYVGAKIAYENPVFQLKNQLFLPNIVEPLETMIQYSHRHETFILAQLYLLMDHIISFSSSATSIRQSDLTNFYIREAIQLIQNHPQHNPTVEELANVCHLNKNYLTRLFSQELGVTPVKFIINYRLNDACQQLASTTKSIAEIAQSVGYTNQFNFSTAFKKAKGLTPFEWRSLYR